MANSERIKITLTLPAEVVRAYRIQAALKGLHDNVIVEQALRKQLGVGLLEELPKLSGAKFATEEEADAYAVKAVRAVRAKKA